MEIHQMVEGVDSYYVKERWIISVKLQDGGLPGPMKEFLGFEGKGRGFCCEA